MSSEVEQILSVVRSLSSEKRLELAIALANETAMSPVPGKRELVAQVRGKYAHVPTSSEAFLARKHEELALEK